VSSPSSGLPEGLFLQVGFFVSLEYANKISSLVIPALWHSQTLMISESKGSRLIFGESNDELLWRKRVKSSDVQAAVWKFSSRL